MASPLDKFQHIEGLGGDKLAVVYRLPQSVDEVIEVGLLHTQEPCHPEDIIPTDLGLSEAVVVAESDGWKVHFRTVHLIQDGDMRVLVILDHSVGHLVEEDGKGGTECRGPEQPSESHSTGQEDVAEAMEGTVCPKHCNV